MQTKWLHESIWISKVKVIHWMVQGHSDSTFSNFFFLETAWLIEAKFYMGPPWDEETEVWSQKSRSHDQDGHHAHIWKKLKKSSSLEPKGWWPWKLVCCIGYLSATKFVQMMMLGWLWPILPQCRIWSPAFIWKKGKTMDFFRNYCSLWYNSQLNEYMKLYDYQRSRLFIDHGPNHSDSIF